jgi:hypothetical protein
VLEFGLAIFHRRLLELFSEHARDKIDWQSRTTPRCLYEANEAVRRQFEVAMRRRTAERVQNFFKLGDNVAGPWVPVLQSATLSGTDLTISVPLSSSGMKFYRLVARQ